MRRIFSPVRAFWTLAPGLEAAGMEEGEGGDDEDGVELLHGRGFVEGRG